VLDHHNGVPPPLSEVGGFARHVSGGVAYYTCVALDGLPSVRHAFSTRHGGVSRLPEFALNLCRVAWDDRDRVEENRRRFLRASGFQGARLATLRQVHSDALVRVVHAPAGSPEGDALATDRPGIALAVQVADCFPVLVADKEGRAVAAVHAGWRGVHSRILWKALRFMESSFGSDPEDLLVAIGPGIQACCMEVGPEVGSLFAQTDRHSEVCRPHPERPGKALLNLPAALRQQLLEAGVKAANAFDLGLCTRCNPREFFSYRSEGPASGRMMGIVGINGPSGDGIPG